MQDIVLAAGIILGNVSADDFQMYAADLNQDTEIDILDIVLMVSQILGGRRIYQQLNEGQLIIKNNSVRITTEWYLKVLKKRKNPRDITNEQIENYMDENNWS